MDQDDLNEFITSTQGRLTTLETNPPLAFHTHNGFDMNKVLFSDIDRKELIIPWTIVDTAAATAANYNVFYISTFPAIVNLFREVHTSAGSAGGAVTVQLEKLSSTTAPGSGVSVLSAGVSLKASANTVQKGSLTTTLANVNLAVGDRLALKSSGTLTSVANVSVLVGLSF